MKNSVICLVILLASNVANCQESGLTATKKSKVETLASALMWWDFNMSINNDGDTSFYLSYVDQRYPNLRPTEILYFSSKEDAVNMFNGIIQCIEDKELLLEGNNYKIRKDLMGASVTNKKTDSPGGYTVVSKGQALKALKALKALEK